MRGVVVRVRTFIEELKRRGVLQVGTVYLVSAWGVMLGGVQLFPAFGAPHWAVQALGVVATVGFPIALILAWVFEVTPGGVVRDMRGASGAPISSTASSAATTALIGSNGVVRVSWRDNTGREQERVFDRSFAIGREPSCGVQVDDPLVSRRHVDVDVIGGQWWLVDLGSRNGTLFDGQRITKLPLPARGVLRLSEAGPQLAIELRSVGATTAVLAPE